MSSTHGTHTLCLCVDPPMQQYPIFENTTVPDDFIKYLLSIFAAIDNLTKPYPFHEKKGKIQDQFDN